MSKVSIRTETEGANFWSYEVRVRDNGQSYDYNVTLSWSDYDFWSHGRVAPELVVRAAFEFLLVKESPTTILPKFDCSRIRRVFPDVDQELPNML